MDENAQKAKGRNTKKKESFNSSGQ